MVNLLDNAVKFSPPGGAVEVRCASGELTVRDHGPGIPAEELPHVFERFWRSPSARALPGSGLGLAIVAQAAAEAGGVVGLDNAAGGGTIATMRLPGKAAGVRLSAGQAGMAARRKARRAAADSTSSVLPSRYPQEVTKLPFSEHVTLFHECGGETIAHGHVCRVAGECQRFHGQVSVPSDEPRESLEAERGVQHHASPPSRARVSRSCGGGQAIARLM